MSILSTSAKLVKVGQDYSAGNGISIDNYVISVTSSLTGEYATQSAFDELNDSFSALSSNLNSNSGIWVDVASTYQTNSSTYLTAHQSLNGYATEQWVEDKGYITGVDLSNYYTKNETSGADQLDEAFNNIPHGDEEVNDVVHTYSADGTWLVANDITGLQEKGDYYSASNPSGFLVPNDISNLASITLVEETSGSIVNLIPDTSNFITNLSAEATYQTIEGMVDYAKASALENITNDYTALSSNINLNSATWNDVENKLYISSYHELSAGSNVDIQNYIISSKDWTNEIEQASAYSFNEATALIPTLTFHYLEI